MLSSILDFIVALSLAGTTYALLLFQERAPELLFFLKSFVVLMFYKLVVYACVEYHTTTNFGPINTAFLPTLYTLTNIGLDFRSYRPALVQRFKHDRWNVLRLFLFGLSFRGLPGTLQFVMYIVYCSVVSRNTLFLSEQTVLGRSLIGSWLLLPVPLTVVVLLDIPWWFFCCTAHYKMSFLPLHQEEEEQVVEQQSNEKLIEFKKKAKEEQNKDTPFDYSSGDHQAGSGGAPFISMYV